MKEHPRWLPFAGMLLGLAFYATGGVLGAFLGTLCFTSAFDTLFYFHVWNGEGERRWPIWTYRVFRAVTDKPVSWGLCFLVGGVPAVLVTALAQFGAIHDSLYHAWKGAMPPLRAWYDKSQKKWCLPYWIVRFSGRLPMMEPTYRHLSWSIGAIALVAAAVLHLA